jgi:flagellar biogenesis protein FliO
MPGATGVRTTAETWTSAGFWKPLGNALTAVLGKIRIQKKHRSLRLQETLPLGEHRFLAVVQWESEKLLVGVTPQGISLLEPRPKKEAAPFVWEQESSI